MLKLTRQAQLALHKTLPQFGHRQPIALRDIAKRAQKLQIRVYVLSAFRQWHDVVEVEIFAIFFFSATRARSAITFTKFMPTNLAYAR